MGASNSSPSSLSMPSASDCKSAALSSASSSPVTIFSTTYCPFCDRAKAHLDALGTRYAALELNRMGPSEGGKLARGIAEITGESTVPQIFICGRWIGGCTDLEELQRQGKLEKMLKDCCDGDVTCGGGGRI